MKALKPFRELLAAGGIHVFDGAMGTLLYAKGVYVNRCYDEISLSNPSLVQEVHREYAKAGAEIVQTNTFGANRPKLEAHGFQDRIQEINYKSAKLAREAVGASVYVAGSIGPLGIRIEPWGPTSFDEAKAFFREQAEALLDGGVDLIVLETFTDLTEIRQALAAVRELAPDLPVVAQMTVGEDGMTGYGTAPETFTKRLDEWGADVIGLNCSVGPKPMLEAIERMAALTEKPLSAQPNAGMPQDLHGRKIYLCSPEYMAKYARRLIQAGVRLIGGCCGTTPEHIKTLTAAVRALSPAKRVEPVISVAETKLPDVRITPPEEKSRFARKIVQREFVTSVEIVPPRGCDPTKMLEGVRLLKEAGVDAVNVPDGPRAQSRMGAIATSLIIEQQVGIETVTHYCCRDRNLLGMTSDLLGAAGLGLRNILIITGDPPKMGPYPDATAVFDIDSIGLTNMVKRLNLGLDLGGNAIGQPTSYFIGVGVNPCAVDLDYEIRRFEYKVEAGAEFAITQPIFDVAMFRAFLKRIEHCRIPIIAGIWPLTSYRNAEFLSNEVPGVVVSPEILERMRCANTSPEAGQREGLAIAREMLAEVRDIVQGVQVSAPFGRVAYALEVFEALR
ncbi:MAG: bifunctional homocysteine S-methyltransferase/methylenetetrahydrofolate reductase [Chloracidobacterium sp.]|uniref:Bifunctional homocysteine S-methyltransferase/methylenetetrahydrofolate reductase n=1 Tax=Chloracidobacterium validum TaxID=2821543 RepID=A0ABX8BC34_9BACT|nr:bifunctional homocysteine S-methyltransferase/methylenetetrahydrofolate reductase [Chloracidobacterium validum]QUW03194.1 bifunctional homocysteine S-methyltransferase/methylenetetrahydrofolate reductase [Chloracidobacterium validum]